MQVNLVSLASLIAAALPTAFFFWIATLLGRATSTKKPWWLLAVVFIWGAIPSIWIGITTNRLFTHLMMYDPEMGLTSPEQASAAVTILGLLSPMVEESVKAIPVLFVFLAFRRHFDGVRDGMLYAAVVGLGFAMTENYQYIYRAAFDAGFPIAMAVVVTRSIVLGLAHVVWSTPFGIGLAMARNTRSKIVAGLAPISGLGLGMLVHGLHNASFLWASLQRSYGVPAVVVNLAIYGFSYIAWLVLAFKTAKRRKLESVPSEEREGP